MLLSSDHRYPKPHRLLKRRAYLAVQQGGRKVTSRLFVSLVLSAASAEHARIGITATRRFGNAVTRNRAKRLVREAFRTGRFFVPDGLSVVVIPRRDVPHVTTEEIFADLGLLSARIARMLENP